MIAIVNSFIAKLMVVSCILIAIFISVKNDNYFLLMKMPIETIGNPIVKKWLTLKTHKIRGENGDYYL